MLKRERKILRRRIQIFRVSPLAFEPVLDARAVASAHGNLLTVQQKDAVFSIDLRAYLFHVLEVDDGGAMDAEKGAGVQLLLKMSHGLPEQLDFVLGTDANVV